MGQAVQDGEPDAPSEHIRRLTALDRLEEYSATHSETFDELGNWPAERFEAAWRAYQERVQLDELDRGRREMVMAILSNGMADEDAAKGAVDGIDEAWRRNRIEVLTGASADEEADSEYAYDAPFLAGIQPPGRPEGDGA